MEKNIFIDMDKDIESEKKIEKNKKKQYEIIIKMGKDNYKKYILSKL